MGRNATESITHTQAKDRSSRCSNEGKEHATNQHLGVTDGRNRDLEGGGGGGGGGVGGGYIIAATISSCSVTLVRAANNNDDTYTANVGHITAKQ